MQSPVMRIPYKGTSALAGSAIVVLYDSTLNGAGLRGAGVRWAAYTISHGVAATINAYFRTQLQDGTLSDWTLIATAALAAGVSVGEFYVEPYEHLKVEYVASGGAESAFLPNFVLTDQRASRASAVVDLSDGLTLAAGAEPGLYERAQDTGPGTVNPWIARIGLNSPGVNTPVHNAVGWNGVSPTVDFLQADNDYCSMDQFAAAQAANPNQPYSFAMPIYRTATTSGYMFAFGDSGSADMAHGMFINSGGFAGFYTRGVVGAFVDNFVGASVIPVSTKAILVFSYRGAGPAGVRVITNIGGVETVRLTATTNVLSPVNFPLVNSWIARVPRGASPFSADVRFERVTFWPGLAMSDAVMTAVANRMNILAPT